MAIRVTCLIKRRPDMTQEQFSEHWYVVVSFDRLIDDSRLELPGARIMLVYLLP